MNNLFVGIDVGGTNTKIMIMDESEKTLSSTSISTIKALGMDENIRRTIGTIERMLAENQMKNCRILAIGMGLPGTVDTQKQKTVHLAYLEWNDVNPCTTIGEHFSAPVIIENDASINALGEYTFGIHSSVSNMAFLTLGTGIGCGIILDGKPFRGANGLGAEIGHMTIESQSEERCLCGKFGHFETFCSGTALLRYATKQLFEYPNSILHQMSQENNNILDLKLIDLAAQKEDQLAQRIFDRLIFYLGIGIGNIMKILNPEIIVIGGGISKAKSLDIQRVAEQVKTDLLNQEQFCPIQVAKLYEEAGMYGACKLAKDHYENNRKE